MSFFEKVPLAAPDAIFGRMSAFLKDRREEKINLGIGLYYTEELLTPVLGSVKAAEASLLDMEKSKEYLPIGGDPYFIERMGELVFGVEFWNSERSRVVGCQSVGGTGALRIGGTFIRKEIEGNLLISIPSWPNHKGIFSACGLVVKEYPYYETKKLALDFDQFYSHLEQLPERTIVLLHASCHNPTGCDPSEEQWKLLCDLFLKKKLIAFFDSAYQGFGEGLEEDARAVRMFAKRGLEIFVAFSCSKNFSLYGERVGGLFIVSASTKTVDNIASRVKQVIRQDYSNPPMHGAKIVAYILSNSSLRQKWEEELSEMRHRINGMRTSLTDKLNSPSFEHIREGKGMFGYTGLSRQQVQRLLDEFAIYLSEDGRINVCGLNRKNIDRAASAIKQVSCA